MSDQVPTLSNTQFAGGLLGGILTINGDNTQAQILAAGTGISIVPGPPGTNTINTNAIQAIQTDDVAANFGGVLFFHALVEGAVSSAITTRQTVPNAEFAVDVRNFLAGHGGLVTDPGVAAATDYLGADNTFRPIPAGGILTSINGDATPAQTLTGTGGITVTDLGGGAHAIHSPTATNFVASAAGGIAVPNNVPTSLATATIAAGAGGTYLIGFSGGVMGVAAQILDVFLLVNGIADPVGVFSGLLEAAAQTCQASGTGGLVVLAAGDTVSVAVNHHGGGAATTSEPAGVWGIKVAP